LPAGVVDHAVYDHTSLLGTVKKIFNLPRFLTGRDEEAHTFEGKFLAEPRPREQTPGPLMQLRAVAPAHVVRAASELRLSSHQTSLEALASAVAAPRNEHEASRRIETRVERFLSRTEAP
jgi:hypothetical protein